MTLPLYATHGLHGGAQGATGLSGPPGEAGGGGTMVVQVLSDLRARVVMMA